LYYYDFDIERTANYLKEKYDKANKPRIAALPVSSKEPGKYNSLFSSQSLNGQDSEPPKMSKLMGLAQFKSNVLPVSPTPNSNGGGTPISKLAALASKKSTLKSPLPQTSSPASTSLASLSILDKISNASSTSPIQSLSRPKPFSFASKGAKITKSSDPQSSLPVTPQKRRVKAFPTVNYQISFGITDKLQAHPSQVGSLFRASICSKSQVTNTLYLPDNKRDNIKAAFSKPSPDDIVLQAQEQGFNKIEKGVRNVKLDSPSPSPIKNVRKLNIEKEVVSSAANRKNKVNFVVIGHVDAGKSTLMGRLLYDCGAIDKHTVEKYKKESSRIGKSSFALAWVFDQTKEERDRGVTIDIAISSFETNTSIFTIVDAPGHRDFVPNMIAGSAQADLAVLVVDAATDAFESGFDLHGQTKEHAVLVRSLGVDRIIVAVNKLDTVSWSEKRFEEIKVQLTEFLLKIGFPEIQVTFIPISGLLGENVVKRTEVAQLSWYKGATLLEQLEASSTSSISARDTEYKKDFRLIVADVYSGSHTSDIIVQGRIGSGSVQVGETLRAVPSMKTALVKTLTFNNANKEWAISGDNITLNLTNVTLEDIKVGDVLANLESVIPVSGTITSRVVIFDITRPILKGTKAILHRGRANEPAKITKIIATVDKTNGQILKNRPRHLISGQTAIVEIQLEENRKIPMETFKNNKELGRFILRKEGSTIAAGIIDEIA
jgi:elongation factor 1 alpha-like protein